MKPLICALALLTMLAPAWAQDTATAPVAASQTGTISAVTLDDGLVVTPVVEPYDDLSSMLDLHIWRFKIKPPTSDTYFEAQLETRTTGKEAKEDVQKRDVGGFRFDESAEEVKMTFGLLPKGGSTFTEAELWRVRFATRGLQGETLIPSLDTDMKNPLKNFRWTRSEVSGQDDSFASPLPNGDILLAKYTGGTPEKPIVVELVLVLNVKPKTK